MQIQYLFFGLVGQYGYETLPGFHDYPFPKPSIYKCLGGTSARIHLIQNYINPLSLSGAQYDTLSDCNLAIHLIQRSISPMLCQVHSLPH